MVVGISGDVAYAQLRKKAKKLEPKSLQRYGFTLDEIGALLSERNTLISGGRLDQLKNNPELVTTAELDSIEKLGDMFVSFSPKVRLKDLDGTIATN